MNTLADAAITVAPGPGERSPGGSLARRLRARARIVREGWLQVFGIPDYERYLAHHALHHADEPALSRREYFAQAIERKYCGSGPRCC